MIILTWTILNNSLYMNSLKSGLIGLLVMGMGCSPAPETGSPVYYEQTPKEAPRSVFTAAEDTLILARIKAKLFSDDLVDQGGIDISVLHGVVFLEGSARDIYHRRMITDLIQTVDGVVRVENRLSMIHTGTTFVTFETLVQNQIKMALIRDQELRNHPIMVRVTADQVILSGSVGAQLLKQKAVAVAKGYAGDRRVVDQLRVGNF